MVRVLMPSALPLMMLVGHALDDHGLDLRELRQLRGQTETGRAGAGDQDIHFLWQRLIDASASPVGRGLLDIGVATAKAIFVELHCLSPGLRCAMNY